MHDAADLDQLAINAIRTLAIDAVERAQSGHPGAPMGLAACAYDTTLFSRHLVFDAKDPDWPNRDRFVLSNGHASMLLYALLHLSGSESLTLDEINALFSRHLVFDAKDPDWPNRDRFVLSNGHASMLLYALLHLSGSESLTLDEIKNFRQWGSLTPGHPEAELTPGVEVTTGPLGQGLATSVGLAMAEAHLRERFQGAIDHHTYVICSDGDLMEGVSHEAASLAGHLQLGRLIVLYDDNQITIDGRTDLSFSEDVLKRFEACGWHTSRVDDGNDLDAVDAALTEAKSRHDAPSLIAVHTVIGYGSPNKADHSKSHGSPLGAKEAALTKQNLGWPYEEPFTVPEEAYAAFDPLKARAERAKARDKGRLDALRAERPELAEELQRRLSGALPARLEQALPRFSPDPKGQATRASGGEVIAALMKAMPELLGGSADLAGSNKTFHPDHGVFGALKRDAQNVHFGVREHAMAAAANGLCLHGGVRGFGATFLIFSDYMRPALRLAALMHVPQLMVFTHDSIGLGEDGPTHQPIEHLAMLRATPNYFVFRPADANEVTECWSAAVARQHGPSALVLTRQDVPTYDRDELGAVGDASQGGYILSEAHDLKESEAPQAILIATGSEVALCIEAQQILREQGIAARVVSLPCWELFEEQEAAWRERVLPVEVTARVSVEAASTMGWRRYVGDFGEAIGLDHFGASAPYEVLYERFGLTPQAVARAAHDLLEA